MSPPGNTKFVRRNAYICTVTTIDLIRSDWRFNDKREDWGAHKFIIKKQAGRRTSQPDNFITIKLKAWSWTNIITVDHFQWIKIIFKMIFFPNTFEKLSFEEQTWSILRIVDILDMNQTKTDNIITEEHQQSTEFCGQDINLTGFVNCVCLHLKKLQCNHK